MATPSIQAAIPDALAVEPYTMHVSSRYLDLTIKKLELTRMPREVHLDERDVWSMGTPKAALEPLIDYWLESYDWRTQEAFFNSTLRQYRTIIQHPSPFASAAPPVTDIDIEALAADSVQSPEPLRIHFLHHQSSSATAIPLLYCHTWPGSFIEISRCIDALVSPAEASVTQSQSGEPYRDGVSFHVVAPSLPGFGFSDSSQRKDFGAEAAADVLVNLMTRLGYRRFAVWADGWGFKIARMLAMHHPNHIAAVYTSHIPDLPAPQVVKNKDAWWKYQVAKFTGARIPWLSFGYTSSDFGAATSTTSDNTLTRPGALDGDAGDIELGESLLVVNNRFARQPVERKITARPTYPVDTVMQRPQTLAYGFCDSPAGLLALLLDALRPSITFSPLPTSSPRAQTRRRSATVLQHRMSTIVENIPAQPTFSPTDILNWTMMYWLPGPEAGLRWLQAAGEEDCYSRYSEVPLGITWYTPRTSIEDSAHGSSSVSSLEHIMSFNRWFKRQSHSNLNPVHEPSRNVADSASPMWAAAVQNLKWIKRRKEEVIGGVSAWERSEDVVRDIRDFFEAGRNEGWLGL